jgi:ABC-type transport system involved in cytochrome c biogenesis permease subunit
MKHGVILELGSETWALITWLVLQLICMLVLQKGWEGKKQLF